MCPLALFGNCRLAGLIFTSLIMCFVAQPGRADMLHTEDMEPWEICGLCHGLSGFSPAPRFPVLAGQRAEYIVKQLQDFRSGARSNDGGQMKTQSRDISDVEIRRVAQYFAAQAVPETLVGNVSAATSSVGEKLFFNGREGVPACAGCHLADTPAYNAPRLHGQHGAYLAKQLHEFGSAERSNDRDRVMQKVAAALTEVEKNALIEYLQR